MEQFQGLIGGLIDSGRIAEEDVVGIRDTINQKPALATGATIGMIVIVMVVIFWQSRSNKAPAGPSKAYFTVDDGESVFEDDLSKIPSFDRNGVLAVQAHMFSCKGGRDKFVGFLEKAPDRLPTPPAPGRERGHDPRLLNGLVKTPKNKSAKWLPKLSSEGMAVSSSIQCPDGGNAPMEVFP
jgi:hypothetical protein